MTSTASPQPSGSGPAIAQVEEPHSWRPLIVPAIVVIIGLAIAWAFFAHFGRSKPDASGTILKQMAYPVRINVDTSAPGPGMAPGPEIPQYETILLVDAKITNVSRKPIKIFDLLAAMKLNGTDSQSDAALPEDIDRVFERFPALQSMRTAPLMRQRVIEPGQSAEGLMVFNFNNWSKDQWVQRKDPRLVVSFQNARTLVIPLK